MKPIILILTCFMASSTALAARKPKLIAPPRNSFGFACIYEDQRCQKLRDLAIQYGGCQFDAWNTEIVYQCYGGAQPSSTSDLTYYGK